MCVMKCDSLNNVMCLMNESGLSVYRVKKKCSKFALQSTGDFDLCFELFYLFRTKEEKKKKDSEKVYSSKGSLHNNEANISLYLNIYLCLNLQKANTLVFTVSLAQLIIHFPCIHTSQ